MKLLFVEDDKTISGFVMNGLKQAGYTTDHADGGIDGMHLALTEKYDLMILDIMLPGVDGLTIIEKMRKTGIDTPVIVLSAKRSTDDRVKGLQTGADDYLAKPFSFSELLARIQAMLRRASGTTEPTSVTVGDLTINLLSREVTRSNKLIELQPKEYALLFYLAQNTGRVISKTAILERLWDYNFDPQTNVVDVLVCRLRNKIDKSFDTNMIYTLRGIGYVLKDS